VGTLERLEAIKNSSLPREEKAFLASFDVDFMAKQLAEDVKKGRVGRVHSTNDLRYQWHKLEKWEKVLTVVALPITLPLAPIVLLPHLSELVVSSVAVLVEKRKTKREREQNK
jgi:hypothetical protein